MSLIVWQAAITYMHDILLSLLMCAFNLIKTHRLVKGT